MITCKRVPVRAATLLAAAALIVLLAGCTGCSGRTALAAAPVDGAKQFSLQVWNESFVDHAVARSFSLAVRELGHDRVAVDVLAKGARGLKALYCDLSYDAQRYAPIGGTPHLAAANAKASAPQALNLCQTVAPGVLHYGQVLANYTQQGGFSGDGVVATLSFSKPGAVKSASEPPVEFGTLNETLQVDGTGKLSWRYYCPADYDMNGEVNIADLTPIGLHFGESGPFDPLSAAYCVDGDHNGEINIADITPLGMFYLDRVSSFRVYGSADAGDWPPPPNEMPGTLRDPAKAASQAQLLGEAPYTRPTGALTERPALEFQLSGTLPGTYYWVRTYDDGVDGNATNMASAGPPQISALAPLTGQTGAAVIFTATVSGTAPFTYAWDFGGGGNPNTSAQPSPTVALGAVGTYNCNLTLSNAFGNVSFPFTLDVSGTPQITAVAPLGGEESALVTFSATVSGPGTLTYAWDFGGGAVPNTSAAVAPQVTLGAAGSYNGTLDVTNEYGSASFPFTLTVMPKVQKPPLELWYFTMQNLLPDSGLQTAEGLLTTAAAAGYTKVVHADYKFGTIDMQSQTYYNHLAEYKAAAEAAGIEIIPGLVPIGYSNTILNHDPDLIEGQPVHDAEFVVNGTTADSWQDPATAIANGGFEDHAGNDFSDWIEMDNDSVLTTVADSAAPHGGATSVRLEDFGADPNGHARIRQAITVAPWNCYAVSFWLKTNGLSPTGGLNFFLFNGDFTKTLSFLSFNVQADQDWTQYYVIFNSQQSDVVLPTYTPNTVQLYMGMWGGENGQFWLDDVSIVNAGLVNLIRRSGTPFNVTNEAGNITYTEGVDYDPVSDPHMGTQGTWGMDYDLYHERPLITIPPGSPIQDGDRLKVSYNHAVFVYDMQPACCLTEEGVYDVIRTTLTEINARLAPQAVFIGVDEMRVANWCDGCQSTGKTPGQLLADCTARIDTIAHEINPAWKLLTWSDMYDPNHNAQDDYYLVNGTLDGSWDGLPASWDIGNWMSNPASRVASATFFADHGNRQILCGYYDEAGPDYTIDEWLQDTVGIDGIYAVMYTPWWRGYGALADWASQVREWESMQPAP